MPSDVSPVRAPESLIKPAGYTGSKVVVSPAARQHAPTRTQ